MPKPQYRNALGIGVLSHLLVIGIWALGFVLRQAQDGEPVEPFWIFDFVL